MVFYFLRFSVPVCLPLSAWEEDGEWGQAWPCIFVAFLPAISHTPLFIPPSMEKGQAGGGDGRRGGSGVTSGSDDGQGLFGK